MLSVDEVDWLDPRAVRQRDAMNFETTAMYEAFVTGQSLEQREAIDDALSVDPRDIVATILVLEGDEVLGHAALRKVASAGPTSAEVALEVKKVYVVPSARGRGVARLLMSELETIARVRGAASLVLETGYLQAAAIALYGRIGYVAIDAFGKYTAIPNALCFEKRL